MIDTDKYEGHTPAPWMIDDNNICDTYGNVVLRYHYAVTTANHTLITDAPLLLEEIERLHEIEREWKLLWSKLEDYPDICAELISFMESEEE